VRLARLADRAASKADALLAQRFEPGAVLRLEVSASMLARLLMLQAECES